MNLGIEEIAEVVDELAIMERDYMAMESIVQELDGISARISIEGVCQRDAVAIEAYGQNILSNRYPLNSFTATPSKTNLVPAMEGLLNKAQELVWTILQTIADFISKVGQWFKDLLDKAPSFSITIKRSKDWKSSVEERLSALEKRLSEIDKSKELSVDEKLTAARDAKDFESQATPSQAEAKLRRDEAYNVLLKASLNQTDKVIHLVDTLVEYPVLRDGIRLTINAIEATLDAYDKNPSIDTLMAALGTTNDLTARFQEKLRNICIRLNRCRMNDVSFGYYDPESPDEFLTSVRNALITASRTPVGKSFVDDFKPGYKVAHSKLEALAEATGKIEKYMDKNDTLVKDLDTLTKRLRTTIKRVRLMSVELSSEQIEIRSRLLDASRLLRRSLFAYMRLREIPVAVNYGMTRFMAAEIEANKQITGALK